MKCHDCNAQEGELHLFGCDMERCPLCGGQLISCKCWENTTSDKEVLAIITKKGRIPWIEYPVICAKCGKLWPDFFTVPDEEWEKYIQFDVRKKVICLKCYKEIKKLIGISKLKRK